MRIVGMLCLMVGWVWGCIPEPKPRERGPNEPVVEDAKKDSGSTTVPTKMTVVDVPAEATQVDVKWTGQGGDGGLSPLQKASDSTFVQGSEALLAGSYRFVVNAVDKSGEVVASSEHCTGETADEFRVATVDEKSNVVVLRLCRPEKKVFVKVEVKLGEKDVAAVQP
jgi:hypothetical protein